VVKQKCSKNAVVALNQLIINVLRGAVLLHFLFTKMQ